MKAHVLTFCLVSVFSINTFALVPASNDATTKSDLCYLTNDHAMYKKGRLQRGAGRSKLVMMAPILALAAWLMFSLVLLAHQLPPAVPLRFKNC